MEEEGLEVGSNKFLSMAIRSEGGGVAFESPESTTDSSSDSCHLIDASDAVLEIVESHVESSDDEVSVGDVSVVDVSDSELSVDALELDETALGLAALADDFLLSVSDVKLHWLLDACITHSVICGSSAMQSDNGRGKFTHSP